MIRKRLNHIIDVRVEKSKQVFQNKNEEYASDENVFANFNNGVAMSFHSTPEKYAWELLCKHLQSIKDIVSDVEEGKMPTQDLINEKFSDAHNYLYLIEGMITEKLEFSNVFKEDGKA